MLRFSKSILRKDFLTLFAQDEVDKPLCRFFCMRRGNDRNRIDNGLMLLHGSDHPHLVLCDGCIGCKDKARVHFSAAHVIEHLPHRIAGMNLGFNDSHNPSLVKSLLSVAPNRDGLRVSKGDSGHILAVKVLQALD